VSATSVVSAVVSTAEVDVADRLAYWEQHNAEALVGLTSRTYAPEGLVASQMNLDLGGLRVAEIAGNPHMVERGPALVRAYPKEAAFVSLILEGSGFFYHRGGCVHLEAGDVVAYRTEDPYLFGFNTTMRKVLVDVPQLLFDDRCSPDALGRPLVVAGAGPGAASLTARALRQVLLELVADPVVAAEPAREQLLDLVQTLVTGRGSATSVSRLLAAKTHIAEHLQDPGLCTDSVALAVRVTPRHLNRAFAAEGTTVAQYVQGRRLDSARVDLAAASMAGHRIADIACRWGFASQAHFTRLFRARFGCTPSDVRAGATPS
jgi:AraC-like DNA-binding protein